jgi:hypothetical protein
MNVCLSFVVIACIAGIIIRGKRAAWIYIERNRKLHLPPPWRDDLD